MEFFLRAKAWQLFLVMVGIPVLFEIAMIIGVAGTNNPQLMFIFMPIIMLMFFVPFFSWLWSLGTRLYEYAPEELRTKPTKLKFGLVFAFTYMVFFMTLFSGLSGVKEPKFVAYILPFHFLSMFFMFYSIYYVARHLALIEENKAVSFYQFAGPFFLLWFFPVGIWFIQPRINKLYSEHNQNKIA
jgi:hypothetical protein